VNGTPVVGWTLPGSDTCFKLTGYLTAQIEGGNLQNGQQLIYAPGFDTSSVRLTTTNGPGGGTGITFVNPLNSPPVTGTQTTTPIRGVNATGATGRTDFGYNTRLNFGFDALQHGLRPVDGACRNAI